MSSDESAIFIESEDPSIVQTGEEPDLDELYKHIPPPIPLIPKNKYKEIIRNFDLRREDKISNFLMSSNDKKNHFPNSYDNSLNSLSDVLQDLSRFCQGSNVAYKREVDKQGHPIISTRVKIDNLASLPKIDQHKPNDLKPECFLFDSRFESGNLGLALKRTDFEYDLLMQNDINTKGHTQWFYFKVQNSEQKSVKFNILNFSKKDSLFNYGMQVLIHSDKHQKQQQQGWHRGGRDIKYFANGLQRNSSGSTYYTLTFTYDFEYPYDLVSFAYCYPYTYSELLRDLDLAEASHTDICMRKTLCLTHAEKKCEILTITANGSVEDIKKRKGAVFSARVHPGETVGSWMLKGLLEFLLSNNQEARVLREKYVFKVIPMLNPDGVIFGNYRCGLAGCDLNRTWKNPSKILHPTIYSAKKAVKAFAKERTVDFICDFHGHSKKKNIFMYGCNIQESPELTRCIPFIISKISPYFCYKFCSFKMQKSKEATMRISLFKETKIPLIYTLEASFFGGDYGEFKDKAYSQIDLQEMGKQVALALLIYNNVDVPSPNVVSNDSSEEHEKVIMKKPKILEELLNNKELLEDSGCESSGSDSDPSEDNLPQKELEPFIKIASGKKYLEIQSKHLSDLEKKTRRSFSSNKREASNKTLSAPRRVKCGTCGEYIGNGHACVNRAKGLSKIEVNSKSATLVYINANGKKVRDQFTQTIKIEEIKAAPHDLLKKNKTRISKAFHSSNRNNINDEIGSLGRIWNSKHLPNIRK